MADTSGPAREALASRGIPFDEDRFFKYIKIGDVAIIRLFLDAGLSPNCRDADGDSALVLAARSNHKNVLNELIKAGADPQDFADAFERSKSTKDTWDRLTALSGLLTLVSSLVIASIGWHFTNVYNERQAALVEAQNQRDIAIKQQQNRLTEMQVIEKMIPRLAGANEQEKRAALLAISSLASPQLSASLAELFGGKGSVEALQAIAGKGPSPGRTAAVAALTSIAAATGKSDSAAALQALGDIFVQKEKSLVGLYVNGQASCSAFVVDGLRGIIASASYCGQALLEHAASFSAKGWDGKQVSATLLPSVQGDPVALFRVERRDLPELALATEVPAIGARLLGVGFVGAGYPSAAGPALFTSPGVVVAVALRQPKGANPELNPNTEFIAVRFESRTALGTGGGPILNTKGDVACMIYSGDETTDLCVPASHIRNRVGTTS